MSCYGNTPIQVLTPIFVCIHIRRFAANLADTFDLRLFMNFQFISLLSTDFVVMLAWQAWVIYLIPFAEQKQLTPYEATSIASVGSIAFPLGLWFPTLIVDSKVFTDSRVRLVGLLVGGVAFTASCWMNSLIGQIIVACPCMAALGACYITSMSIAKTVNVDNFSQVVAYEVAASSIGRYLGGLIGGNT